MSLNQNSDTFCIFCYKTIDCDVKHSSNVDSVKKFIGIFGRFVGRNTLDTLLKEQSAHVNQSVLLFKCCKDCSNLTDKFCDLYHQLKLLELELLLKLDKLTGKIEHANKVPTRWIHLNKVLENTFPNDLGERKQSQNLIREIRQGVVQAAHRRALQCHPRVLVEKSIVNRTTILIRDIDIDNQDNLAFSDDDDHIDTNQDSSTEECEEDSHEKKCIPEVDVVDATKLFAQRQFTSPCDIDTNREIAAESEDAIVDTEKLPSQTRKVGRLKIGLKQGKHKNGKHLSGKNKCHICGRKLSSAYALKTHLEYHKDPKEWQYQCGDCKKKFAIKHDLNMHMRKHTREQPYVCQICGEKYGYRISLRKHLINKHPNGKNENSEGSTTQNRKNGRSQTAQNFTRKLFQKSLRKGGKTCPKCGKKLSSATTLRVHLEYHKDPEDWQHKCEECGKKFARKPDLNMHLQKHTRVQPYVCRFCGEKYGYKISLRKHLSSKHGDEKGVEEEIEGRLVKNMDKKKKSPRKHKKTSVFKNYRKQLATLPNVKENVKKNKVGEGRKCDNCLEIFRLDKELWLHQSQVHKEKVCLKCGKQYKRNDHLNLHLEYHKDPKEWKFECKVCGKKCPASYKLKEHMARHTEKKKVQVRVKKKGGGKMGKFQPDSNKKTPLTGVVKNLEYRYRLRKSRVTSISTVNEMENKNNDDDDMADNNFNKDNSLNDVCEMGDNGYENDLMGKNQIGENAMFVSGNVSAEAMDVAHDNSVENVDVKHGILIEAEELNEGRDKVENEGKSSMVPSENNLWTRKGTCFGDGTLVEFEDLD